MRPVLFLCLVLCLASSGYAQEYDILLKGGHVLDAGNRINAVRDVAIKDGKVAAIAENIQAARALKTVDVTGLYVTPGLIDLHTHVYRSTVGQGFRADNSMVYPDGFSTMPSRREHGRRRDSLQSVENNPITAISGGIARR